jgi:putative tricarboxylic transport membrane protein
VPQVLRATVIGTLLGVLPGRGPRLAAVLAQRLERRLARRRSAPTRSAGDRGRDGLRGGPSCSLPECARAHADAGHAVSAVTGDDGRRRRAPGPAAGPQRTAIEPVLPWAVIASMWIGNRAAAALNLPLAVVWRRLLRCRTGMLFPALVVVCCVGLYAMAGSPVDVYVGAFFGFVGFASDPPRLRARAADARLRARPDDGGAHARAHWRMSPATGASSSRHPLAAALLFACAAILVLVWLPTLRRLRERTFRERG